MTLASALEAQVEGFKEVAPLEVIELAGAKTQELAESGIVEQTPQVGDVLKDFELPNAQGENRSLTDLRADGPVVITFYRGGWCPYCNLELNAWQEQLAEVKAAGATLVAITPELPDSSLTTAEKNNLEFEVLTDKDSAYIKQLGLVFTLAEELRPAYEGFGIDIAKHNGNDTFELPLAATYVVNTQGEIVSAWADADYTKRQEPSEVVGILKGLN